MGDHCPLALQRAFFNAGKTSCLRGSEQWNLNCHSLSDLQSPTATSTPRMAQKTSYHRSQHKTSQQGCACIFFTRHSSKMPSISAGQIHKQATQKPLNSTCSIFIRRMLLRTSLTLTHPWTRWDLIQLCRGETEGLCWDDVCRCRICKTNHSLRATGATALFNAGMPERTYSRRNRSQI